MRKMRFYIFKSIFIKNAFVQKSGFVLFLVILNNRLIVKFHAGASIHTFPRWSMEMRNKRTSSIYKHLQIFFRLKIKI